MMIRMYATTIFTAVLLGVGATSVDAALVPVASYSYDATPAWATHWSTTASEYTTPTLLTDGNGNVDAAASDFQDGSSVGFVLSGDASPQPLIDVDLGGTFSLDSLDLYYLVDNQSGILSPASITVSGSLDGTTYSSLGSLSTFPPVVAGDQENRKATVSLGGGSAAYLRVDVRNPFDFVFLTELEVNAVPEPGSLALVGFGIASLLTIRRRRDR